MGFVAVAASDAKTLKPKDTPVNQPVDKAPVNRCHVPLWSVDPDPAGLNVRKSFKSSSTVVGVLPQETMLTAIDSKNGWFKYTDPQQWNWPEAERIPVKKGPRQGWVYGGLLSVDTECRRDKMGRAVLTVYTAPNEQSAAVVTWVAGEDFSCDWHIKKPLDCQGGWLKAVLSKGPKEKPVSGWLHPENLCDNPLTTCAGY